ncbi:hypothetical protein HID58_034719 [Brassica napus]|uniref:DUF1664 domain-containing protein n=1 Tax=Brassica napus TaxID=3708 RepID=A0ABQ8C302_BRANA|nr:hypothetical protein HID58_034719 [Brassica napus]
MVVAFRRSCILVLRGRTCEVAIYLHLVNEGACALVRHTVGDKSFAVPMKSEIIKTVFLDALQSNLDLGSCKLVYPLSLKSTCVSRIKSKQKKKPRAHEPFRKAHFDISAHMKIIVSQLNSLDQHCRLENLSIISLSLSPPRAVGDFTSSSESERVFVSRQLSYMALPLGKLTILLGAGLVGSVLAKDGGLPDVSSFVSGAFKMVFRQLKQGEPVKSASKPHSDALTAQVNSLRHELQLLASNRPITIISTGGSGGRKYAVVIIIGVIGYGYVWWKGLKLEDFMFATRRSLSDACDNVGTQIDGFYSSLSGTKKELGSEIDRMDRTLDESSVIIKQTGREVNELRDGTANMKDEVRSVFEAVETLASKVHRIEGNQDLTLKGVGALHAQCLEHKRIQESNKALPSTSSLPALEPAPVTPSSRTLSLPPPSPRESQSPSTPNGAQQSNGPLQHTQSMSGLKDISENSSSGETSSNGTHSGEATGKTTSSGLLSIFSMPRIGRTRSAVNAVPANSTGPQ